MRSQNNFEAVVFSAAFIQSELAKRLPKIVEEVEKSVANREENLRESIHSEIARAIDEIQFPEDGINEAHLQSVRSLIHERMDQKNSEIRNLLDEHKTTSGHVIQTLMEELRRRSNGLGEQLLAFNEVRVQDVELWRGNLQQATEASNRKVDQIQEQLTEEIALKSKDLKELLDKIDQNHTEAREKLDTIFRRHITKVIEEIETQILGATRDSKDADVKLGERITQMGKDHEKQFNTLGKGLIEAADFLTVVDVKNKQQDEELATLEKGIEQANEHRKKDSERLSVRILDGEKEFKKLLDGVYEKALSRIEKEMAGAEKKFATKEQLNAVKEFAKDLFEKFKQKVPKDGKDADAAHEWEFKFHEHRRGLFMYKRDDWDEWKTHNLLGPQPEFPTHSMPQLPVHFMGGGGGGTTINIEDASVNLHVGNTASATLSRIFVDQAVTASDGTFAFDYGATGILHPYSIQLNVAILEDNPGLDIQERIVEVYYDLPIGDGMLTGVAFYNRKVIGLLGRVSYAKEPVGAGVVVRAMIVGDVTI